MSDSVDSFGSTVGPPASTSPVPVGHHDGGGSVQSRHASSAKRGLIPKKERIRRGRCRDKDRIAKLKAKLSDRELAGDRSCSTCRPTLLEQGAAIRAATSAALASAVRQFASLEQAESISADVRQALLDLAPFATVPEPSLTGPAPGLGMQTAHPEHSGTEAEASAANGLGSSTSGGTVDSDRPDEYDIFDADDELWHSPLPACRAAADVAASGCSANADAAAGMVASPTPPTLATGVGSSLKTLVEVHELCALPGGEAVASPAPGNMSVREACTPGSSNPGAQNGAADFTLYNAGQKVSSDDGGIHDTGNTACTERQYGHEVFATFEPDAQPVLSDAIGDHVTEEPDEYLKDSDSRHLGKSVFSSGTPGSSNPGAQNGAEELILYNAAQKVSSYSEGLHETAKTALLEQQCGQVATANFGHEPVHELLSCRDMSLKPFNSQDLANTCVDQCGPLPVAASQQCGPLPLNASPRAFDASSKSDFNSQNLANEHVPSLSETAGLLQNSPASPRAAIAISENGHGLAQCESLPLNTSPRAFDVSSKDSISQSLADPQVVYEMSGAVQSDFNSQHHATSSGLFSDSSTGQHSKAYGDTNSQDLAQLDGQEQSLKEDVRKLQSCVDFLLQESSTSDDAAETLAGLLSASQKRLEEAKSRLKDYNSSLQHVA